MSTQSGRGVAIVSVGARTSVGLDARQTAFMLRAGAAGMTECALVDSQGEAITFCGQQTIDPLLIGGERAARLAIPAFEEAIAPVVAAAKNGLRVGLILCVDEFLDRFGKTDGRNAGADLVALLHGRAKELIPKIPLELCARGAAGAAVVMPKGIDAIAMGHLDAVVVGGVHTDYDPTWIAALETDGRLYSSTNLDALIPGEAAAFALLMKPELARRAELEPYARIDSVTTGWEDAGPHNDKSAFEAKGLSVAMRLATKELVDQNIRVGWLLTDMTFEMRKIYEFQAMFSRTYKVWTEPYALESHAQRIGHLGAAALPLSMVLAYEGWKRNIAPDTRCIAYAGSDGGDRGILVMSAG